MYIMTERLKVERISADNPVQPPWLKADSATAGCLGPPPVVFQVYPRRETLQPLWATSATVPSTLEEESLLLGLNETITRNYFL